MYLYFMLVQVWYGHHFRARREKIPMIHARRLIPGVSMLPACRGFDQAPLVKFNDLIFTYYPPLGNIVEVRLELKTDSAFPATKNGRDE